MVEKLIEVVLGDGQLLVQLADRLRRIETAGLQGFAEKARMLIPKPAIIPFQPSLTPPGAETARLEGHAAWVTSLCLLADGRLVSGSQDNTIRLWDMAMGAETACLEGQVRFGLFAFCRTGGSPRALGTTRSGCGM
jgi:WD40 repeat protein